ncbi:MAG TPA: sigma-70 family RNA polymerase sigma factor [Nannocystaceae bacterium]|nr:sigma-70 family RNA polymerase sigma factor [Nannocystaceae bacterium]
MAKPTPTEIAALVRAHSHRLHRFFGSSGVPRSEAQDLVQATFEVLLRKLEEPIDDLERYLWGIARTKLLQTRTRLKTYEEFHYSQFAASTTTISQKVDRRLRVSVLLARLDEEERTIFRPPRRPGRLEPRPARRRTAQRRERPPRRPATEPGRRPFRRPRANRDSSSTSGSARPRSVSRSRRGFIAMQTPRLPATGRGTASP